MATNADLDPAAARRVLDRQPFSSMLGAHLAASGPDRAVLELSIRDDLRQRHGFVHGGVIGYLVDNAITFAGAVLGPDIVTGGFSVEYARTATAGLLRAEATVVQAGVPRLSCGAQ